jgi:hypothetical protein
MKLKRSLKMFLGLVIILAILNAAYADSGPNIRENQARALAQDYLNSHNLSYNAVTPNIETDWKAKVKVIATGEVKWIPFGDYKMDAMDNPTPKYEYISQAWVVKVTDKNGKNVGVIYVNPETGEIMSSTVSGGQSNGGNGGSNLEYQGNGTGDGQTDPGILGTIQNFFQSIISFFQQLWISIFGGG